MARSPLVLGLAAVFAGLTALLSVGAVVSRQPVALFVAVPFALTSSFMYYHGTGRLARAVHRRAAAANRRAERDRSGGFGFGAGSREAAGGDGSRTRFRREARGRGRSRGRGRTRESRRRDRDPGQRPSTSNGPTAAEARRTLGVSAGADPADVRRAYREKVKSVHPDRGGDEETFKRVTAAYDRLTDE